MASGNESRFGRLLLPLVAPVALLVVSMMMGYLYLFVMDLQRSVLETNLNLREIDGRYKAKIARLESAVFLLSALSKGVNRKQTKSNSGGQVSARPARPVAQSSREIIKRLKMKPAGFVDKQTDQRIRKGEDLTGDLQMFRVAKGPIATISERIKRAALAGQDSFDHDLLHRITKRSPSPDAYPGRRRCRKGSCCCKKRRMKGKKGAKGERGERGERGDRGERGERGDRGPVGEKGERGPRGAQGKAGPEGPTGATGPKGDKGADGNSKTTELIHLVGHIDGPNKIRNMGSAKTKADARFKDWKKEAHHGKIDYRDGYINIKVSGFYYVYCQLNYNGKILYNRHQVLRNDDERMLLGQHTFGSRQHTNRHTGTKYTAGVFRLHKGDRINMHYEAKPSLNQHIVMKNNKMILKALNTWTDHKQPTKEAATVNKETNYVGGTFKFASSDKIWITNDFLDTAYLMNKDTSYFGVYLIHAVR